MLQNTVTKIGWFASMMGICMFISFIDQIRLNLGGQPGSIILPLATMINCMAWTSYGALKEKRDWPLICSNGLGILLGALTAGTVLIHPLT
jgi:hypothetical protein